MLSLQPAPSHGSAQQPTAHTRLLGPIAGENHFALVIVPGYLDAAGGLQGPIVPSLAGNLPGDTTIGHHEEG